jgi:signal transduction histidine kinase
MGMRRQLAVGIGGQVLLLTLVCAIALGTLTSITSDVERSSRAMVGELDSVRELRRRADRLLASARRFILTGDVSYKTELAAHERGIAEVLQSLGPWHLFDITLDEAGELLRAYEAAITSVVDDRERMTSLQDLEHMFEQRLSAQRVELDRVLEQLETTAARRVDAAAVDQGRLAHTSSIALFVACASTVALCVVIGILVARRLGRQIRSIEQATRDASDAAFARRQLLDVVAHDLKSPLNTIVLGLDVLRETKHELPCLEPIENAARRMCRLVDDLLDTSRAQSSALVLELSTVDCRSVLEMAAEMFAEPCRRSSVHLNVECPAGLVMHADRDRVLQILANLMGNALRVSERGSTINLTAIPTTSGVRITVGDSGPGIPPEQVAMIFDAYRQGPTGTLRGSLGLGLYISRSLVEAHGGRIGVDTMLTRGSTFWFELPRREGPAFDSPS